MFPFTRVSLVSLKPEQTFSTVSLTLQWIFALISDILCFSMMIFKFVMWKSILSLDYSFITIFLKSLNLKEATSGKWTVDIFKVLVFVFINNLAGSSDVQLFDLSPSFFSSFQQRKHKTKLIEICLNWESEFQRSLTRIQEMKNDFMLRWNTKASKTHLKAVDDHLPLNQFW